MRSKSRHLEKYPVLINWDDPRDIPYDELAEQWKVHKNVVIALVGRAKTQPSIYHELLQRDYTDGEIPGWVARPSTFTVMTEEDEVHDENIWAAGYNALNSQRDGSIVPLVPDAVERSSAYFPNRSPSPNAAPPNIGQPLFIPHEAFGYLSTPNGTLAIVDITKIHGVVEPRSPFRDLMKTMMDEMMQDQLYEMRRDIAFKREIRKYTLGSNGTRGAYTTPFRGTWDPCSEFINALFDPEYLRTWNSLTRETQDNIINLICSVSMQNRWEEFNRNMLPWMFWKMNSMKW